MVGQGYSVRAAFQKSVSGSGLEPLHGPGQRGGADVAVRGGAGEAECRHTAKSAEARMPNLQRPATEAP